MNERKTRTTQVVIYVPQSLLDRVDDAVARADERRSGWIVEAVRQRLERERQEGERRP